MWLLNGPQDHRHLIELVELALERHFVGGKALQQNLERLVVHRLRLGEVEAVGRRLVHGNAAPDTKLEAPAAHLVEHADLFDQAQRVVERQQIDQRAKPQILGAVGERRHDQRRRGCRAQRRRVVLGDVVAVEARAVVGLGNLELVGVELAEWHACIVDVVEYAEFHFRPMQFFLSSEVSGPRTWRRLCIRGNAVRA